MATVEQAQTVEQAPTNGNGAAARQRGDPGRESGDRRDRRHASPTSAPRPSPRWRQRGRDAQPSWEAYGFDGRARVLLRAQKWLMDNADQVVATIVSETGKTFEDAAVRRDLLRRQRVRLLGQARAASTSPTSASSPASCSSRARS